MLRRKVKPPRGLANSRRNVLGIRNERRGKPRSASEQAKLTDPAKTFAVVERPVEIGSPANSGHHQTTRQIAAAFSRKETANGR